MVREHVVSRFIVEACYVVSPLKQHLEDPQLVQSMRVSTSFKKSPIEVVFDHWLLVGL